MRTDTPQPEVRRSTPARKLLLAGALLLVCAGLAACGSSSHSSTSSTPATTGGSGSTATAADVSHVTLRVGDQAGVGAQAVLTAAGLIGKLPFKVHWSDFTSGPPTLQAMSAGAVDVGGVGNAPPVFAAAGGGKISLVAAQRNSPGFSALLVPSGSSIRSVGDLKGKRIAVPQGSSSDYHLLVALHKAGIDVHDVTLDYLQPAEALAALGSGKVDAADLWQPFVEQAVAQDHARVLLDARGIDGNDSYTVAATAALSDPAKKAAIGDYLKILDRAYRWAGAHPQQWAAVWAKATGLSPSIMVPAAKNAVYTPIPLTPDVIAAEQTVANTFSTAGLIPNKVDFHDHAYTGFNATLGGTGA